MQSNVQCMELKQSNLKMQVNTAAGDACCLYQGISTFVLGWLQERRGCGTSDRLWLLLWVGLMVKPAEPMLDLTPGGMIFQGAESKVYEVIFLGKPTIVKHRFSKKYRLPDLDEKLTHSRIRQEARSMLRARNNGILAPVVYLVDTNSNCLYMEKIFGRTVREALAEDLLFAEERMKVLRDRGRPIAKLHDKDLIHGDLTTSNVLIRKSDQAIVLIDFGLSYYSRLAEDKGVDLYVLERAITSAHPGLDKAFATMLEEYEKTSHSWTTVNDKYREVRMRGRKRSIVG